MSQSEIQIVQFFEQRQAEAAHKLKQIITSRWFAIYLTYLELLSRRCISGIRWTMIACGLFLDLHIGAVFLSPKDAEQSQTDLLKQRATLRVAENRVLKIAQNWGYRDEKKWISQFFWIQYI